MSTYEDYILDSFLSTFAPEELDEKQRLLAAMLWEGLYFRCLTDDDDERAAAISGILTSLVM